MNTDKRRAWFVELQRLLVAVNSGGVGVSSSDIVGWFRRGQQEWAEAAILALRDTADLRTENARLRGEVDEQEGVINGLIEQEYILRADLAHLTAERDDLKEWKVLHAAFSGDAAAECGRLRESLAVDEAEMASLREWLRDRTSERDDLLNSARDRNARHQRASFKHIAPVYICPTDDACIRLMRDSDKGRLTIFDEDLDSTGVYGVVEIDEQEGVNALFLALASYVDADTLRAAVAACAPPASGSRTEPCGTCGHARYLHETQAECVGAPGDATVCGCQDFRLAARPAPAKEP
jgi:hypothetical protein